MHELGIAQALVEQVQEICASHGARGVLTVAIRVGTWRLVVEESLRWYFDLLTQGTPLEGSRLEVERIEARARCRSCGREFKAEPPLLVCPECESLGGELVSGQELDLVSVELAD